MSFDTYGDTAVAWLGGGIVANVCDALGFAGLVVLCFVVLVRAARHSIDVV